MLKEKLMKDKPLTSGLFFNLEEMGKIMKVIKNDVISYKAIRFLIFSKEDPAYIDFADDPGVFIIMPY